jgi:hypothetical protein
MYNNNIGQIVELWLNNGYRIEITPDDIDITLIHDIDDDYHNIQFYSTTQTYEWYFKRDTYITATMHELVSKTLELLRWV